MSIAYLVLAHRAPDQIGRLAQRLLGVDDHLFLHVDRRSEIKPFAAAIADPTTRGRAHLAQRRVRSRWASFALLEATLGLIEQAVEETECSHLCLLSGDSYPLVPISTLHAFFERAGERSFVFHDDGSQPAAPDRSTNATWHWNGDLRRVTYHHYQLGDHQIHLPNRYVPSFPRLRPPADMPLLQGSQWWTLSRNAARFVVETFVRRPELARYFRRVQAPDEWAVQMVLANSHLRETIVNDDLHFISWQRWHAGTITLSDIPHLSLAPKLFARKLGATDQAVAEALDQLIAARESDGGVFLEGLARRLLRD